MKIRIITGHRRSGLTTKYLTEAVKTGRPLDVIVPRLECMADARRILSSVTSVHDEARVWLPRSIFDKSPHSLLVIDDAHGIPDPDLTAILGSAVVAGCEVWILTQPPTIGTTALWDLAQRIPVERYEGSADQVLSEKARIIVANFTAAATESAQHIKDFCDSQSLDTAKGASLDAWAELCSATIRRTSGETDEALRQRLTDHVRKSFQKSYATPSERRVVAVRKSYSDLRLPPRYFVTYEGQIERAVSQEDYEVASRSMRSTPGATMAPLWCDVVVNGVKIVAQPGEDIARFMGRIRQAVLAPRRDEAQAEGAKRTGVDRAYVYPSGRPGRVDVIPGAIGYDDALRGMARPETPDHRCTCRARMSLHLGRIQAHHKTCQQWSELDADWCAAQFVRKQPAAPAMDYEDLAEMARAQGAKIRFPGDLARCTGVPLPPEYHRPWDGSTERPALAAWERQVYSALSVKAAERERDEARDACKRMRKERDEAKAEVAEAQKRTDAAHAARDKIDMDADKLRCEVNRLRGLVGPLVQIPGECLTDFAARLRQQAKVAGRETTATFNNMTLLAKPGDGVNDVLRRWAANLGLGE